MVTDVTSHLNNIVQKAIKQAWWEVFRMFSGGAMNAIVEAKSISSSPQVKRSE